MNRAVLVILGIMAALVVAVGVLVIIVVSSGDDGETQSGSPNDNGGDSSRTQLRLRGPEPITLDPHIIQDASSALYVVEIFGGLLTLDTNLEIQPDLAVEIPTIENGGKVVNPDGTVTYTFTLREDALFHDRKPVLASTVKFSFERAADPNTRSLVAEFFLGDIIGVTEKLRGEATEVSGIRVVDDKTIEITIDRDLPSFLFKLTYPTAFVVDPSQVDSDDNWTRQPNGTGPYKLKNWRFGERIELEANARYHLGAPIIETVRYELLGSSITLYEAGELDVAGIALDDLERIQDPADPLNAEYRSGSRLSMDYLGFNTNTEPFDDPLVRRAFAMAIDKEQIARAVFQDAIPVANSIVMPGLAAYSEQVQAPLFDPEQARQLLADSSYGGPEGLPEITLAESGTGATAGAGTSAILEMWRQNLDVEVEIQQAESATFFQDVDQGRYQMFTLGWIMDYPDEEDILNIHFDSESPNNNTFYSNPEVDALLREALTEPDSARRIELYQQAEQLILDDVPWFPLFFDRFHALVKPYVNNYLIPPAIVPRLRFISFSSE
ncbi:MAG: peptide ABC transporter substrate-binding protein [Chloroflexi bacterium]|nr:peptide ABC transporter substrate-binding protein [Chloroflexota bacterium]